MSTPETDALTTARDSATLIFRGKRVSVTAACERFALATAEKSCPAGKGKGTSVRVLTPCCDFFAGVL